jgi:sugar phosphate isomerase/epimerase
MSDNGDIQIILNSIALDPNRWTPSKMPHFRLVDLLPPMAEHGFRAIELWQYHVDGLTAEHLSEIRSSMGSLDMTAPVLGIYPSIHFEGEERRREIDHIYRLMDTAHFLGADTVKLFVGSVASGKLDDSGKTRSVAFLREITDIAKEFGIRLTGETHANTLFDTVQSTLQTLEQLDPSRFGVCFQPYDASLAGATGAFTALQDRIWHLHYQGRKSGEICLLEDADLYYASYTDFVRDSGFVGYLCIEFVKDCVVASPELLDVALVLSNAVKDREFIASRLGRSS